MRAIHQFLAGFTNGDAISNEALALREVFRSWGVRSELFSDVKRILPALRREAHHYADYAPVSAPEDIVLLHLSMGSPVNDCFAALNCRKAILYHNITPPHYYELINPETAARLASGRRQIKALANVADINLADSRFNAGELLAAGYRRVEVLPLILPAEESKGPCDRATLRHFGDGKINVLFVGRCAPNKKIEDAIRAFALFHRFVDANSRFIHVGSFAGTERYYYLLLTQVRDLGLRNVHFAGAVPQRQLNAFYSVADLFLCMSEHEGFCIPVLEGMGRGVPVMAYAAGAVPETMGDAGVLFHEKRFEMIAEMMGLLCHESPLRRAVIEKQNQRVLRYRNRDLPGELHSHLSSLLGD